MSVGRVTEVYKTRLGCTVLTTVVGNNTVTLIPVDAFVVDFDEAGGQLLHQPTGDIFTYASADVDAETITLSAGLPTGKTFAEDDALYVYPRADDYYADVVVDDVDTDVVSARVPQILRTAIVEGGKEKGKGPLVRLQPGAEEWEITGLAGEEPVLDVAFLPGDLKPTARAATGNGQVTDGGWLMCDGTAVNRTVYAALFAAIGTTYGAGNGTTTFNVPDLRGRTIFGTGTLVTRGQNDGAVEANRGPGHTHVIPNHGGHAHGLNTDGNAQLAGGGLHVVTSVTDSGGAHDHSGATGNGLNSVNPLGYMGINYLIKI